MGQISTADYGQLKQGQIVHCLNKDRGRAGKSLVISHLKPGSLLQTLLNMEGSLIKDYGLTI